MHQIPESHPRYELKELRPPTFLVTLDYNYYWLPIHWEPLVVDTYDIKHRCTLKVHHVLIIHKYLSPKRFIMSMNCNKPTCTNSFTWQCSQRIRPSSVSSVHDEEKDSVRDAIQEAKCLMFEDEILNCVFFFFF